MQHLCHVLHPIQDCSFSFFFLFFTATAFCLDVHSLLFSLLLGHSFGVTPSPSFKGLDTVITGALRAAHKAWCGFALLLDTSVMCRAVELSFRRAVCLCLLTPCLLYPSLLSPWLADAVVLALSAERKQTVVFDCAWLELTADLPRLSDVSWIRLFDVSSYRPLIGPIARRVRAKLAAWHDVRRYLPTRLWL